MAKKKSASELYEISLKLGDKLIKGAGTTVLEALQSMPKPAKIMAKGVLTLSKGDKKEEQLMYPPRIKRLFYSPSLLSVIAKQLSKTLQ